jgi:hypothetical protein
MRLRCSSGAYCKNGGDSQPHNGVHLAASRPQVTPDVESVGKDLL